MACAVDPLVPRGLTGFESLDGSLAVVRSRSPRLATMLCSALLAGCGQCSSPDRMLRDACGSRCSAEQRERLGGCDSDVDACGEVALQLSSSEDRELARAALDFLFHRCRQDDLHACRLLGRAQQRVAHDGLYGEITSEVWDGFKQQCRRGDVGKCREVGLYCLYGLSGSVPDQECARTYLGLACDLGSSPSCSILANDDHWSQPTPEP